MEELATTGTLHRFGRSVQFFEEKCSASDLYSGKDTASLWSERAIFRRKMLSERPGLWVKISTVKVKSFFESPHCHFMENRGNSAYGLVI